MDGVKLAEMTELEPCPFCGGETIPSRLIDSCGEAPDGGDIDGYLVECAHCLARGPHHHGASKADAIAAWNRRSDFARALEDIGTVYPWPRFWMYLPAHPQEDE